MKKWFVYIIRAGDNSLYTGVTTDVQRRFKEHNSQSKLTAKYLRGKLPLKLEAIINAESRKDATKLEAEIKRMTKLEKEKIIFNLK